MNPTCYCQDLRASAPRISSMYLFTQPIFLPHYFPACLCRGCLFSLLLSLPVSPSLLLSLTHPLSPPSLPPPPPPPHSFAHRLSFSDTHTHTNTHRGTCCALLDQSLWLQYAFRKGSFISRSLDHNSKPRLFPLGSSLSWNFTHLGFIMIRRCSLISIFFAAAVQGNISVSTIPAISSEEIHLPSCKDWHMQLSR